MSIGSIFYVKWINICNICENFVGSIFEYSQTNICSQFCLFVLFTIICYTLVSGLKNTLFYNYTPQTASFHTTGRCFSPSISIQLHYPFIYRFQIYTSQTLAAVTLLKGNERIELGFRKNFLDLFFLGPPSHRPTETFF